MSPTCDDEAAERSLLRPKDEPSPQAAIDLGLGQDQHIHAFALPDGSVAGRVFAFGQDEKREGRVVIGLEQMPTVALEEGGPEEAPPEGRPTDLSSKYFRTAARLIMEVAEALEYAHSQGVVHRDIKPDNLMLTPEGHLVVTDFGLARFLSAPSITISGEMMGTPAYMSPEQVRAEQQAIDHRTDIYSLGVTLYEMLALEVPFRADTREALLRQILMKDPAPLRRLNPRIPRDLETISAKAIEKDPNRRYPSAKLLAHDLHCFLEGLPITARPIGPLGRVYRRALRRKALTAALAGVLVAVIVGTFFGLQSLGAHRRAEVARRWAELQQRLAEAERRAREVETAAKREVQRWHLLDDAEFLLQRGRYGLVLENLKEAAAITHDHVTRLSLWRLASLYSNHPLATLRGRAGDVNAVAFSPDGKVLASGNADHTIKLWDLAAAAELRTLRGHSGTVYFVAFAPDGRSLASASADRTIKVWDVASGAELRTFRGHSKAAYGVAFSPNGEVLASASHDGSIKLWDAASGKELLSLPGHTWAAIALAFSPDGGRLASTGGDGTVRLWHTATGKELRTFTGHRTWVWSVAFGPEGKVLASGEYDGAMKLWDVETGREIATLKGHIVAFSPDGRKLAYTVDKDIYIADLHAHDEDIERWLREAVVEVGLASQ